MNLIVGYQLRRDTRLVDSIIEFKKQVSEVYFAWPGIANGRSTRERRTDLPMEEAIERQREDLSRLSRFGFRLNLLLNGNCYGMDSLSRNFYQKIGDLIDSLDRDYELCSVTTASPVIAGFVKRNFAHLEIRASVNMEIGTREGVEYLANVMDGFYVKREMNRNIECVRSFSEVCRSMGKKVYLLANSGCLNHCSARQFHDNLVSHEEEIARCDNAFVFDGLCRQYLSNDMHKKRILQISNWLRPEDLQRYEGLVDGAKIATRISDHPEMILRAYATGHFAGNLLSLTEPDFSAMFYPMVLSAKRMPEDFFERTSVCDRACDRCGYCIATFENAAENLGERYAF